MKTDVYIRIVCIAASVSLSLLVHKAKCETCENEARKSNQGSKNSEYNFFARGLFCAWGDEVGWDHCLGDIHNGDVEN